MTTDCGYSVGQQRITIQTLELSCLGEGDCFEAL